MSPGKQLESFIAKHSAEVADRARAALTIMRKRLPGAVELVYDNYNALAIAFSTTEAPKDIVFSIALYPRWVSLFFAHGAELRDPERVLKGKGTRVRHVVLSDLAVFDAPSLRALMDEALARARPPLAPGARGRIVIQSVSPKQRPRRPGSVRQ